MTKMTKEEIASLLKSKLMHNFGVSVENATDEIYYKATVMALCDIMTKIRTDFEKRADEQGKKQVCYMCMEFLLGRSLKNTLYNLGLENTFGSVLKDCGVKLDNLY